MSPGPLLSGLVIHWRCEAGLARLVEAWPADPRFELLVVDNGSRGALPAGRARVLTPPRNLGFAGGVTLAAGEAGADLLLLLNADLEPRPGALEQLLEGFERLPAAAGLAPRLESADGSSQHRWQLRPLPGARHLLAQCLFLPMPRGAAREPAPGAEVAQPAGAALALRRAALAAVGGLDAGFYPAWFEDVDLARRLAGLGRTLHYWPAARFRHQLGSSVAELGYGDFLWLYYRNLLRYAAKHHGPAVAGVARTLLPVAAVGRLLLLPVRRPRRTAGRREAARALLGLALAAGGGWRWPASRARAWAPPPGTRES